MINSVDGVWVCYIFSSIEEQRNRQLLFLPKSTKLQTHTSRFKQCFTVTRSIEKQYNMLLYTLVQSYKHFLKFVVKVLDFNFISLPLARSWLSRLECRHRDCVIRNITGSSLDSTHYYFSQPTTSYPPSI